mmetsp:Transcript_25552/g.41220  ORF Transcript_25552/g.41220 Transcript_25552/m.41220 type:complete len:102 (+) Transcript_25552:526-831(+)
MVIERQERAEEIEERRRVACVLRITGQYIQIVPIEITIHVCKIHTTHAYLFMISKIKKRFLPIWLAVFFLLFSALAPANAPIGPPTAAPTTAPAAAHTAVC